MSILIWELERPPDLTSESALRAVINIILHRPVKKTKSSLNRRDNWYRTVLNSFWKNSSKIKNKAGRRALISKSYQLKRTLMLMLTRWKLTTRCFHSTPSNISPPISSPTLCQHTKKVQKDVVSSLILMKPIAAHANHPAVKTIKPSSLIPPISLIKSRKLCLK